MANPVLHRVHEATFLELVLFDDLRGQLLALLAAGGPEAQSTLALIGVVAAKCEATPADLRKAVAVLEAEASREADDVLLELLFHPELPADELMRLARQGRFLTVLGHRAGPRELLEYLAERHAHPEAITTLALDHYGAPTAPARAFRDFVRRHADVAMLEHNLLRRALTLDAAKQAIVRELFGERPSRPPKARGRRRR